MNENKFAYVESNKNSMLMYHDKNALCDGYIVEFLHDATENYYERGSYAFTYCKHIKFPLYVLNVLKLHLFCLPMLDDSFSHKLFALKTLCIGSGLNLNVLSMSFMMLFCMF